MSFGKGRWPSALHCGEWNTHSTVIYFFIVRQLTLRDISATFPRKTMSPRTTIRHTTSCAVIRRRSRHLVTPRMNLVARRSQSLVDSCPDHYM